MCLCGTTLCANPIGFRGHVRPVRLHRTCFFVTEKSCRPWEDTLGKKIPARVLAVSLAPRKASYTGTNASKSQHGRNRHKTRFYKLIDMKKLKVAIHHLCPQITPILPEKTRNSIDPSIYPHHVQSCYHVCVYIQPLDPIHPSVYFHRTSKP